MTRIIFLPKFERQFNKLPEYIREMAIQKESIFRSDPFHPFLKTHKLKGRLGGCWAFSVNYDYRIIFKFTHQGDVRFYEIGLHKIYD